MLATMRWLISAILVCRFTLVMPGNVCRRSLRKTKRNEVHVLDEQVNVVVVEEMLCICRQLQDPNVCLVRHKKRCEFFSAHDGRRPYVREGDLPPQMSIASLV